MYPQPWRGEKSEWCEPTSLESNQAPRSGLGGRGVRTSRWAWGESRRPGMPPQSSERLDAGQVAGGCVVRRKMLKPPREAGDHRGRAAPLAAAITLVALAVLTGCASASDTENPSQLPPSAASPTAAPSPSETTPGGGPTAGDSWNGYSRQMADFVERCTKLTKVDELAEIIYDANPQMQLNHEEIYELVVQPPSGPTPTGPGNWAKSDIRVTCTIQAELIIGDADVTPTGWVEQTYVTAPLTWTWEVTPRREGELEGHIELRPIAIVGEERTKAIGKRSFDVRVTVRESFWDWLQRVTTQIETIRLFVLAVVGLFAALGVTKWFRRRQRATTDSGKPESAAPNGASDMQSPD